MANSRPAKNTTDYWKDRIIKPVSVRGGKRYESRDYNARMAMSGRREFFNLGTGDKAKAAKKACEIYRFLFANGWEATLAKFKPFAALPARATEEDTLLTVEQVSDLLNMSENAVREMAERGELTVFRPICFRGSDVRKYIQQKI